MFYGDSITATAMGHDGSANFPQLINASNSAYFPAQENGGIGFMTTNDVVGSRFNTWLAAFSGRYVSIAYGTNDAAGGGGSPPQFFYNYSNMGGAAITPGEITAGPKSPLYCANRRQPLY